MSRRRPERELFPKMQKAWIVALGFGLAANNCADASRGGEVLNPRGTGGQATTGAGSGGATTGAGGAVATTTTSSSATTSTSGGSTSSGGSGPGTVTGAGGSGQAGGGGSNLGGA